MIGTSVSSLNYDYSSISTQEHMFVVAWTFSIVPFAYFFVKTSLTEVKLII